jgi:hypothetical protein
MRLFKRLVRFTIGTIIFVFGALNAQAAVKTETGDIPIIVRVYLILSTILFLSSGCVMATFSMCTTEGTSDTKPKSRSVCIGRSTLFYLGYGILTCIVYAGNQGGTTESKWYDQAIERNLIVFILMSLFSLCLCCTPDMIENPDTGSQSIQVVIAPSAEPQTSPIMVNATI